MTNTRNRILAQPIVRTTCSDCWAHLTVRRIPGTVTGHVPSNGIRGRNHVPAHDVTESLDSDDGELITWDCPVCGYADSFDTTY